MSHGKQRITGHREATQGERVPGLAHLATALGVPSVVIFTGYGSPEVLGYKGNLNLVPQLPYAPCWEKDGCEPCKGEICTAAIEPEFVAENLLGLLAAGRRRG